MDFGLREEELTFLKNVRTFLEGEFPERDDRPYLEGVPGAVRSGSFFSADLLTKLAKEGYWSRLANEGLRGVDWPEAYGGAGRSAVEQWLFLEEMAYRRLPAGGVTLWSIGRTLILRGTDAQKLQYLPAIMSGDIEFALGYTEPEAGSDLAALRTRAARRGDKYVVNGQKLFTTAAERASHLWLAARTGSLESKHQGISVFIVPLNSPGLSVVPLQAQSGELTNQIYLEDVEVPLDGLVGEEDQGWRVITTALNFERLHTYAGIARDLEELVASLDDEWAEGRDAGVRRELAELVADLEAGRLLAAQTAVLLDQGIEPVTEAAMVKIWLSELRERLASTALGLFGEAGQQRVGSVQAPADGMFEESFRYFPVRKFAAGTNDALRSVIARRGLDMPRS
jgi:alkylation response protein AidB-like acyl-CoA dehydrogenase